MLQALDKGVRHFIEDEALKLQKNLKIQSEPNVYDFASINKFFKDNGWRFQFNAKLNNISNSMENDAYLKNSMEYMIKYNVIESKSSKTLQFEMEGPKPYGNKFEYIMFLRALFYEYWGELKKKTVYNGIGFEDDSDYKLFSRAMIIPYGVFRNISMTSQEFSKISNVADSFNVIFSVVEDRIVDCGWIGN